MIKEVFILDRNKKVACILSNSTETKTFFDYSYKSFLETGADIFDFSVQLNEVIEQYIVEMNYILFEYQGKYRLFQIMQCSDEEDIISTIRIVHAETIGLELSKNHVRACTIEGNIRHLLTTILQDTNYEVGYISPRLDDLVATITVEKTTAVYTVIQNSIEMYNNCEFEFAIEKIDSINGKYKLLINCYADGERGRKTYKRFDYDFNTSGTSREGSAIEFASGIIPTGIDGITIKDIEWHKANGDPLDKPLGQDFLLDPSAHEMYNNGDKYILTTIETNDSSASDLIWSAYNKLQEVKKIKFNYEIPIEITDEEYSNIEIGDTVYIVNDKFSPPIQLEARISELEIKDKNNNCKFSNFKEIKSNIKSLDENDIIKDVIDKITSIQVGKLTMADILILKEYLIKLGVEKDEVEKIFKSIVDALNPEIPTIPEVSEDTEDYTKIFVDKIDGGLWLGDERIFDLKKYNCAAITTVPTPVPTPDDEDGENPPSDLTNQQYAEAVKYYQKFNLGAKQNSTTLANIINPNNKYKINTIVKYWARKYGLDPNLIFAMITAESGGNPYAKTQSSGGGYGIMQCERSVFFNKKQTIKFLDGSTQSFTPSYSTMTPYQNGNISLNGSSVDKNISNQIMFGCDAVKKAIDHCHGNIFATLTMYNMGIGSLNWIICKYICDTYKYPFKDSYSLSSQVTAVKTKFYEELDTLKCNWSAYRKIFKDIKGLGTPTNIELYLQWYQVEDGQLPYYLDRNGNKIGYGVGTTNLNSKSINAYIPVTAAATSRSKTGSEVRQIIVDIAKKICAQHQQEKIATYDQACRTVNFKKPRRYSGTLKGIKNPICYDCSSLVSCAYLEAGLESAYNASCAVGTLVANTTKKSGYKMWKATATSINEAIAGDIIMMCKSTCPSTLSREQAMRYNFTGHTLIYCGVENGKHMVAHARKWDYWPNAIQYMPLYSDIYNRGFFLRPYDLAEADKNIGDSGIGGKPGGDGGIEDGEVSQPPDDVVENINEITIKAVDGAVTSDYIDDEKLITVVEKNDTYDYVKYPRTVPYIYLHFGINDLTNQGVQSYKNLILALKSFYRNTTIFIAKELKVNSTFADHININNKIDLFNNQMENFANEEENIIFMSIDNGLTLNGMVDPKYSKNGYRFDSESSAKRYYNIVKKTILAKAIGSVYNPDNSEESESVTNKIDILMQKNKTYKYETVKDITFSLPSTIDNTYFSRLIFTTNKNSEPTKFTQAKNVYLEGTDCKNGALIPLADTTYNISIMPTSPEDIPSKNLYYGVVSGIKNGGKYTDFKDFIGKDKVCEIAKTYFAKKNTLTYKYPTPVDFSNPFSNISKWKNGTIMNIDSSAFLKLIFMGMDYSKSPYYKNLTSLQKNSTYNWTFVFPRTAAEQCKYCVRNGWIMDGVDFENYTNVEAGDIIFYDTDIVENNRYMNINFVSMCIGPNSSGANEIIYIDEVNSGTVSISNIKDYKADKILVIARPRKD